MNEDLKIIKKKYGEDMMHLCRDLFPTLLEKRGLLPQILLNNFHENHYLSKDIVENNLEYYFHRAGRTGRFDKSGVSYFFYNDKSLNKVDKLLTRLKNIEFEKFDNDGNLFSSTYENNKKNVYEKGNKELIRKANSLKTKMTRKGIKPGYKKKIRIKINKERRYMRRRNKI